MLIRVTNGRQKMLFLCIDVILDDRAQIVQRTWIVGPQVQRLAVVIFCQIEVGSVPQKVCVIVVHLGVVRQDFEAGSAEKTFISSCHDCSSSFSYFSKLSLESQSWFLVTVFKQKKHSTINPAA
jgi:hypothetical protein